jgi:hypothetical protein
METTNIVNKRTPMLSWVVLPLLGVWLATNYLLGLNKKVDWGNTEPGIPVVLGTQTDNTATAVSPFKWEGNGLVTFWFDDAWYSQYSVAFPILNELDMPGAIAVPTGLVQGDSYMGWPQIKRVQSKGWEITSHSINHTCLDKELDRNSLENEIKGSQDILKNQNLPVESYVTPCGVNNSEIISLVKNTYLSLRTSTEGINSLPVTDPYDLKIHPLRNTTSITEIKKWIHEAENTDSWLILVFHQIGYDQEEYEITPEFFKDVVESIQNSQLSAVLPSQALQVVIPTE